MTTIKKLKLECHICSGRFYAHVLGSFGFREVDENLCKKYWGFLPHHVFLAMCPHCKHVNYPSEFIKLKDEVEEDLLFSEESCEKYLHLITQDDVESNSPIGAAYLYHQHSCCKKMKGEEYQKPLRKAHHYFKLAQEQGVDEFMRMPIEEWISATQV